MKGETLACKARMARVAKVSDCKGLWPFAKVYQ